VTTSSVKMAGLLPELEIGNFGIKSKNANWTTVRFCFTVTEFHGHSAKNLYHNVICRSVFTQTLLLIASSHIEPHAENMSGGK
jgi:hypothetical protein